MSGLRSYRNKTMGEGFWVFEAGFKDTDLQIGINPKYYDSSMPERIIGRIIQMRMIFENHISSCPQFLSSMTGIDAPEFAEGNIQKLYLLSKIVNVGPMAGIAGFFAQEIGNFIQSEFSAEEFIVENGGDVFLKTKSRINVLIETGNEYFEKGIILCVEPFLTPCGICTSSGKFGHSLNLGRSDSFTVVCQDPVLADMFATSLSDVIKSSDDLETALGFAEKEKNILFALGVCDGKICLKPCSGVKISLS
ncbi:UPF0280 family protein [candidate division WOR-3 bacterium]|nr:UPF0280 family protein [candidate division WOR-3 bacterium]